MKLFHKIPLFFERWLPLKGHQSFQEGNDDDNADASVHTLGIQSWGLILLPAIYIFILVL